ncbi:MAG: rod shape-determining protein MreD [Steroidobacteraceae bacterium]|nr:rod shape-determining protein MreD [Steroidobacteraceae bacterium]MDW8258104.1 rod shape-determining protein MreD [Gammaproteobacteria bacterium]
MSKERLPRGAALLTTLVALLLQLLPLPLWLSWLRPAFAVLTVLFWSIASPRTGGLALGFVVGLALDVFRGAVLGQHALALALITYIAIRYHLQLRNKPLFEQALWVGALLFLFEAIVWSIDGWSGQPMNAPGRWVHVLTGAAMFPIIVALLDRYAGNR